MSSLFAALSALSNPASSMGPEHQRSDNQLITGAPTVGAASVLELNDSIDGIKPTNYVVSGR